MAAVWIAERKLHTWVFTTTSNSMAYSKWPFIIGSRPPSSLNSQSWIADSIFILNGCHLLEQAGSQKRYTFVTCVFVCRHTWLQILAGQRGVDDLVLCRVCLCSWSLQCGGVGQWWICVRVYVKFSFCFLQHHWKTGLLCVCFVCSSMNTELLSFGFAAFHLSATICKGLFKCDRHRPIKPLSWTLFA